MRGRDLGNKKQIIEIEVRRVCACVFCTRNALWCSLDAPDNPSPPPTGDEMMCGLDGGARQPSRQPYHGARRWLGVMRGRRCRRRTTIARSTTPWILVGLPSEDRLLKMDCVCIGEVCSSGSYGGWVLGSRSDRGLVGNVGGASLFWRPRQEIQVLTGKPLSLFYTSRTHSAFGFTTIYSIQCKL
jgi:hypothetical protein